MYQNMMIISRVSRHDATGKDRSVSPRSLIIREQVQICLTGGVVVAAYGRAGEVKTGSFELERTSEEEMERRKRLSNNSIRDLKDFEPVKSPEKTDKAGEISCSGL